ncbi:MAG TPA: Os1348 family NHLP clan protein [Ktedonosporobacter sp.]|nr:Os1348 family NHLP clan protein [Ktedonosporobacter sp.]
MSWNSINELIGLALIDSDFCQELLDDPVAAAQKRGVELTSQEQDVLSKIHVDDIFEFSQIVLDKLAPGNP